MTKVVLRKARQRVVQLKTYVQGRLIATREDLRAFGRDVIRASGASLYAGVAVQGSARLAIAGLLGLVCGAVLWMIGLPKDDQGSKKSDDRGGKA